MALFFLNPTIKVAILQLRGAVEKIWKKDRLKITGGRNKKRILEKKKRAEQEKDIELDSSYGSKNRRAL